MTSRMLSEAREAPSVAARLLTSDARAFEGLAAALREDPPASILTVARGSSDHAAHFLAYLVMSRLGRLVTSLPMSVVTLHHATLHSEGLLAFAFSQSGRSPDLVEPIASVRAGGARTVAFVNDPTSPLAQAAQWVFPLHAGEEKSVAATKSYIAQLVCGARLVAHWQQDPRLLQALDRLPADLHSALQRDWSTTFVEALREVDRLYVIARGTGLAVAMEAALKFKEVCGIQAEAFSGAEVRHGPIGIVDEGYPLLVFAPPGPAQEGLLELARALRAKGARVLLAAPEGVAGANLPLASSTEADLNPILAIQSFYPAVEALGHARGRDVDQPRNLSKVTKTL